RPSGRRGCQFGYTVCELKTKGDDGAHDPGYPYARCETAVKYIVLIARALISLFGITLVVLGILFWTGHAMSLLPFHMMLGGLFVVCLWVVAVLGFLTPGSRAFALLVLVW